MSMIAIKIHHEVSKILQSIQLSGDIVRSDPSDHITMFYFEKDDMSIEDANKIIPIVYEITSKAKPFIIDIKSYKAFPEGKYGFPIICEVKCSELMKLREDIKKAFEKNDIKFSNKFPKFIPHITLSYMKKEHAGKFDDISFQVNKISLYVNSDNKKEEKIYVEFPFGKLKKESALYINDLATCFEKLATANDEK